jgi:hypothetical protein
MSDGKRSYGVQVEWATVVPLGDTLAIATSDGVDEQWVKAFEVVLDEHERQAADRGWRDIDFEYAAEEGAPRLGMYVREIRPEVQAGQLRQTVDSLVKAANSVAEVGTHVYELARELREAKPEAAAKQAAAERPATEPGTPRPSTPPPPFDPVGDELEADAA